MLNISCPLDSELQPAVGFNCNRAKIVKAPGKAIPLILGRERQNDLASRFETVVRSGPDAVRLRYVECIVNFYYGRAADGGLGLAVARNRTADSTSLREVE